MANKYNSVMDHITMSEEMQRRILQNIENEVKEAPKARVDKSLSSRNAKITRIIGIVAAAGIVLTIGGIVLAKIALSSQNTSKANEANAEFVAGSITRDATDELEKSPSNMDGAVYAEETTVADMDINTNSIAGKTEGVESISDGIMLPQGLFLTIKKAEYNDGDVSYVVSDLKTLIKIRSIMFSYSFGLASTNEKPIGTVFKFENSDDSFEMIVNSEYVRVGNVNYSYSSPRDNGSLEEILKDFIMENGVKAS